ncbi:unnamed protein product, partial [Closterium sp. Naga37s-1]
TFNTTPWRTAFPVPSPTSPPSPTSTLQATNSTALFPYLTASLHSPTSAWEGTACKEPSLSRETRLFPSRHWTSEATSLQAASPAPSPLSLLSSICSWEWASTACRGQSLPPAAPRPYIVELICLPFPACPPAVSPAAPLSHARGMGVNRLQGPVPSTMGNLVKLTAL